MELFFLIVLRAAFDRGPMWTPDTNNGLDQVDICTSARSCLARKAAVCVNHTDRLLIRDAETMSMSIVTRELRVERGSLKHMM